jgi:hypothetical protein
MGCGYGVKGQFQQLILFDVNTAIWLADPPEEKLVIFDNLGWYCDVTNIFICQRQVQIVTKK